MSGNEVSVTPDKIFDNSLTESYELDYKIDSSDSVKNDSMILGKAISQWYAEDWASLSEIDVNNCQDLRVRSKVSVLVASGYQQLGNLNSAKEYFRLAETLGCSRELIKRIMIAGVYNTLGRLSFIKNNDLQVSDKYFNQSIAIGMPQADSNLMAQLRAHQQLGQVNQREIINFANLVPFPKNKDSWTALITLYKRSEYLEVQLCAIANQSVPPQKIIIIQNERHFEISPDLLRQYKVELIMSEVNSLYSRWIIGYLFDSEYVCAFDDDVIPGSQWIDDIEKKRKLGWVNCMTFNQCKEIVSEAGYKLLDVHDTDDKETRVYLIRNTIDVCNDS
jgi:hypothetical protein